MTEAYPAGRFPARWPDRPPTNSAALASWLAGTSGVVFLPEAISELVAERVLAAAERAAVLRLLAQEPGLQAGGVVADRAGRLGHAFSVLTDVHGLPSRHLFVVGGDGRLLAYQEVLTETAGRLRVSVPAVVRDELYLVAEHVPAVQVPAAQVPGGD
jgi:hypothetical protein